MKLAAVKRIANMMPPQCDPQCVYAKTNTELANIVLEMAAALRPIAAAYDDDPGESDLYPEQPVTITLGNVRIARYVLAQLK